MTNLIKEATTKRLEDVYREIGTLLLAFAPLEVALSTSPSRWLILVFFLTLGGSLFAMALVFERRRLRVD